MDRETAETSLLGRRVLALVAGGGSYVGELVALVPGSTPWHGRVRVDGIVSPASHYQAGRAVLAGGAEIGSILEVAGGSLAETNEPGFASYAEALEAAAVGFSKSHAAFLAGQHGAPDDATLISQLGWHGEAAAAYRQVAAVRRALDPLEAVLALPGGREAVTDIMQRMAREGALPPRQRQQGEAGRPWAAVARSVICGDLLQGIETGFRDELVGRSRYSLGLDPEMPGYSLLP